MKPLSLGGVVDMMEPAGVMADRSFAVMGVIGVPADDHAGKWLYGAPARFTGGREANVTDT